MYSIAEFCKFVGISERLFHTLKAQGLGPDLPRIGRRVLIGHDAAKRWLSERTKLNLRQENHG